MTIFRDPRLRGLALPSLFVLLLTTALVLLGNWQLERLAWKNDLIARANERPLMAPAPAPPSSAWPDLDVEAMEYRPVRLSGRYLADREALVFTTLSDPKGATRGPGFWVVTPFELDSGGTVLVNRGFVPQERRAADQRDPAPAGQVAATGLLRPDDNPNWFTPENRPEQGIFFSRNIAALAAGLQLHGPVAPFTVDLLAADSSSSGLPQAGETRFAFTNNHLGYAVTWYGLALSLLAVFAAFVRARLRSGVDGEDLTAGHRAP